MLWELFKIIFYGNNCRVVTVIVTKNKTEFKKLLPYMVKKKNKINN